MVEGRSCLGFLDEATDAIAGLVANVRWQYFQCDFAIEFGVVGEVNLTHATRAELGADFVATNSFARGERQCSGPGELFSGLSRSNAYCSSRVEHAEAGDKSDVVPRTGRCYI